MGDQGNSGPSRQITVGNNKSQKPPMAMQSAVNSNLNTPQDTGAPMKAESSA